MTLEDLVGKRARITVNEGSRPLVIDMEFAGRISRLAPESGTHARFGASVEVDQPPIPEFKGFTMFVSPRYVGKALDDSDEREIVIVNIALRGPSGKLLARGIGSLEVAP